MFVVGVFNYSVSAACMALFSGLCANTPLILILEQMNDLKFECAVLQLRWFRWNLLLHYLSPDAWIRLDWLAITCKSGLNEFSVCYYCCQTKMTTSMRNNEREWLNLTGNVLFWLIQHTNIMSSNLSLCALNVWMVSFEICSLISMRGVVKIYVRIQRWNHATKTKINVDWFYFSFIS